MFLVETGIYLHNMVIAMAVDCLAPFQVRPSTTMVLNMQKNRILYYLEFNYVRHSITKNEGYEYMLYVSEAKFNTLRLETLLLHVMFIHLLTKIRLKQGSNEFVKQSIAQHKQNRDSIDASISTKRSEADAK